ncbi:TetR/AcrR family transcriptional regulator [Haloechinothrix salitolerans]|uniref:TetR/AcrR family transcriptional regulator n=1 Tax=Haloechinothrix salitolerans TaxID=926830 RepID=A0ABW2C511_9PSEU
MPRAERERQMIDVAVTTFAERGYVATSMDDIAERVGVSKPMLYEYFHSKEGLLLAAIREARTALRQATERAVTGATTGKEVLERGLLAYFRFMAERQDAWSLLRHELSFLGPVASEEVEAIRQQQTDFNMLLMRAHLTGASDEEVEAAAEILVGACERMAVWYERHDHATPELATQYTMNIIWNGMAFWQESDRGTPAG